MQFRSDERSWLKKCTPKGLMRGLLILSGIFVQAAAAGTRLELPLLWEADADMVMEGAPMAVDLDGDGDCEIITAAYENIIVVDGNGQELWRYDTRGRYSTCPAILERKDQSPLIYAADNRGMFTCLDGDGQIVWQVDTAPVFCASPSLADLDGDGTPEVIQGHKSGTLSVYDALKGTLDWQQTLEGDCSSPAVGDLNGDGKQEIIIATTKGLVYALANGGETLWQFDIGSSSQDWSTCSPVIFQNSDRQRCVAAGSQAGRFVCLDSRGNILWEHHTRGAIASTISTGDPDGDGRADLFAVTQLGVLYRFDESGRLLWEIDTQGRSLAAGALIDLDADGSLEYILSTQRGNLLIFNMAGEIIFNHQFESRTINVTPAFGDIVKDRPGPEMALTGGEGGRIYCLGLPATATLTSPWSTYRGNQHLTAAWFGLGQSAALQMIPENLYWDQIYTGTEVIFRINNPDTGFSQLKAYAGCLRPDGSRQSAVGKIIGHSSLLALPVKITAPGPYQFHWKITDPSGKQLVSGAKSLTLRAYENDQALVQRAILVLHDQIERLAAIPGTKSMRAALKGEFEEIEQEAQHLATLQQTAAGAAPDFINDLDSRTEALNSRARRGLRLAAVIDDMLKDGTINPLVPFEGVMWENRAVDRQLPEHYRHPLKIKRRCITGEHEPISIKLLNLSAETLPVTCLVQNQAGKPEVTPFEVEPVPTNQNTLAWDPLVPIAVQPVSIPPLETREIWLDVDLAGVAAGQYNLTAVFNDGKPSATDVQINLDVLPFTMAGYDKMRLCCWASYNKDAIKDLLAHGNTVFTLSLPPVEVVHEEPLQLDIDFSKLDNLLKPMQGHNVYLLMQGIPDLGVPMEDGSYIPRLGEYFDKVMQHLVGQGITEDHIALYPHDEPGGHGWDTVNHYIAFARQALKAYPGLKFYVNGGGDLAMFEALNEVASIWCPSYYTLPEKTPLRHFIDRSGKIFWTYDCGYAYARPIGANVKTINIVAQYRLPALFANHYGATGIGYWCYNVGPSMWNAIDLEYPLVYTNEDGTNTRSRRWEAVRESVEDARILIKLQQILAGTEIRPAVREQIEHLIRITLPAIAGQSMEEARLGVARYLIDASNNDDTVRKLREELLDCVSGLVE